MPILKKRLDARTRRKLTFYGYALALVVLAGIVLGVVVSWSQSKSDDRLAVIANWLAAGTLALAFLAGVVALQAYANASGQPDLKVRVYFIPVPLDDSKSEWLTELTLTVWNDSLYAAKSPGVLLRLEGMATDSQALDPGWSLLALKTIGITQFQWDSQVPIHGRTTRDIHLDLVRLHKWHRFTDEPIAIVKLMADGYESRDVRFPVPFKEERPVPTIFPSPDSWA